MTLFYVRAQGTLPSGEQWNSGLHVTGTPAVDDVATAATDAVTAFWSGAGPTSGYSTLVGIGTSLDAIVVYQLDGSIRGGTRFTYGSGGGRYAPYVLSQLTGAYRDVPDFLDSLQAFQPQQHRVADMIVSFAGAALTAVISSKGRADRAITGVDVGDVFDAQRRRRDKIVEVRHTGSLG